MEDEIAAGGGMTSTEMKTIIFSRELAEIYLLLDYLSGQPGKSLADLVSDYEKKPETKDAGQNWLEVICAITWPPDDNTDSLKKEDVAKYKADKASVLLRARDKLNSWASPATGATIAFTLLVVGGEVERAHYSVGGKSRKSSDSRINQTDWDRGAPSRTALAQEAFPGLVKPANRFRKQFRLTAWWLGSWLLVTCALSWTAALWQADLVKLDQARAARGDLLKRIDDFERSSENRTEITENKSGVVGAIPNKMTPYKLDCRKYSNKLWPREYVSTNKEEQFCTERREINDVFEASKKRRKLLRLDPAILDVISTATLPIFYGVLGAGASMLRTYWAKIKSNVLSPSEATLSIGQLALGAVIGSCIGLFITPGGGSGGLTGTVTLSASALSFIAGFGADGVFLALESLLKRVFNIGEPSK